MLSEECRELWPKIRSFLDRPGYAYVHGLELEQEYYFYFSEVERHHIGTLCNLCRTYYLDYKKSIRRS